VARTREGTLMPTRKKEEEKIADSSECFLTASTGLICRGRLKKDK